MTTKESSCELLWQKNGRGDKRLRKSAQKPIFQDFSWFMRMLLGSGPLMKARITISLRPNGELEIALNPEGRDLLVHELQSLNTGNEHFHLGPDEFCYDIQVSTRPYNPDDRIVEEAKVLFRTDEWDRQYFPHVLDPES
jgi:hypothetical protein